MSVTKLDVTKQIRAYLKNFNGNPISPVDKIEELYRTADVLVYNGKEYPREKSNELLSDLFVESKKVSGNEKIKSTSKRNVKMILWIAFGALLLVAWLISYVDNALSSPSSSSYSSDSSYSSSYESAGPEGTYYADLTIFQSGYITKIVLNKDGSAEMTTDGEATKYTYWDYASDARKDVRISDGNYGWWFIDFSQMKIYCGADDYRSNQRGYTLRRDR